MPLIVCDRLRMLEVFQNLIVNAVKFNDKPEPLVEIGCRRAGDDWEFYVRDNGPGIEERYFQKIFEIFQRLHRREDNDGVGAGLTIAKKIVEMHKGKIWVQSRPGEGAVFYFTIPAITVISSADAGVHHATR
jgi:chemotaxis family two-component system sensor kinase Cph1